MAAPVMALVAQGAIPPPNPNDPSPFALHDPVDLEGRLRSAGFGSVRADRLEFSQGYPSFDEYWAETMDLAAPLASVVGELPSDTTETVRAAIRHALAQFTAVDGRIQAPATAVVAVAVA